MRRALSRVIKIRQRVSSGQASVTPSRSITIVTCSKTKMNRRVASCRRDMIGVVAPSKLCNSTRVSLGPMAELVMATNMMHNLRKPLKSQRSSSSMLMSRTTTTTSRRMHPNRCLVLTSTMRMMRVVKSMISYCPLESRT